MDPNTHHQRWSHWTCDVVEPATRHVNRKSVQYNAGRYFRMLFGQAGKCRVSALYLDPDDLTRYTTVYTPRYIGWRIEVQVEGVDAHDPGLVDSVRRQFVENFVKKGWGPMGSGTVDVRFLAGDRQDGRPRDQMVEIPTIRVPIRRIHLPKED